MTEMNPDTMYSLLREIKSVAMSASLTGSLKNGTRILVEMYGRCLEVLAEQGDTQVKSLFPTLDPESTSLDEVGAAAALLSRYVKPALTSNHRYDYDDDDGED
jgi:hypothetical protein